MHDTGMVRRVDELGRIVIPMELRRTFGIKVKDPISILVDGDRIILEKYKEACPLCGGEDEELVEVRPDVKICTSCIGSIKDLP